MAGNKWRGWVCGCCKQRLPASELVKPGLGDEYRRHVVQYLADYCGDQARYEDEYCGPVRFYGAAPSPESEERETR